ncbi:MAG: hypothetical protein WC979_02535 [Candidatus Pacearchaeota archaeon]|jgi:hypothetical protein|nr:hypothetical protein [Clostridia bacterium]
MKKRIPTLDEHINESKLNEFCTTTVYKFSGSASQWNELLKLLDKLENKKELAYDSEDLPYGAQSFAVFDILPKKPETVNCHIIDLETLIPKDLMKFISPISK